MKGAYRAKTGMSSSRRMAINTNGMILKPNEESPERCQSYLFTSCRWV